MNSFPTLASVATLTLARAYPRRSAVSSRHQAVYARLGRAMEEAGMRVRFRKSELVETPPHPRRVLVFRLAVWPSPRKRGEVRRGARQSK